MVLIMGWGTSAPVNRKGGEVPEGLLYYCCLSIMIHRYPEMSGVLIYGLRGESPHSS